MSAAVATLNALLSKRRDPPAPFSPSNPPTPAMFGSAPPVTIIPAPVSGDWSVQLDAPGTSGSGWGKIVQGIYDVQQCIGIILTTPPGSDPFRPDFACDLFQYLDRPISRVITRIVSDAAAALLKWEQRIKVLSILPTLLPGTLGQMIVAVNWRLALAQVTPGQTTTVMIGRTS